MFWELLPESNFFICENIELLNDVSIEKNNILDFFLCLR